jgi:hypothetical protein
MTQRTFHAELNSREFPYNFRELSSTVVFNQGSEIQRGIPGGFAGPESDKNFGVCQAYYLDNAMPISRGYSSVSFTEVLAGLTEVEDLGNIISSFTIRGPDNQVAFFAATNSAAYVYDPNGGTWQTLDIGGAISSRVFYAIIKEITYIYYGYNIYVYNFQTQLLEQQTLNGIDDVSLLDGICAAGSQLIAWNSSQVFRSSVLDPLDFDPSQGLTTGAGVTGVLAVKGKIVLCLTLGQDFIIYTTNNAVSARQTGSLQYPFTYKAVVGSAGVQSIDHVAYNTTSENHLVWTASGFQQVTVTAAEYVFPELSDGITRGLKVGLDEDFEIPVLIRTREIQVKLNFVSERWLAISTREIPEEATSNYTDCYVYDTTLARWGKLTVPHINFLEYGIPEVFEQYSYDDLGVDYQLYDDFPSNIVYATFGESDQITTSSAGNNFGLVRDNADIYTVSWSETQQFRGLNEVIGAARPRIIFGKYKAFRTRGMVHQSLKVNKLHGANIKLYGHDYTGRYVDIKDDLVQNDLHTGQWFGRLNADSISIGFDGEFIISDLSFVSSDSGTINQKYQQLETLLVATTDVYPLEEPQPDAFNLLELEWDYFADGDTSATFNGEDSIDVYMSYFDPSTGFITFVTVNPLTTSFLNDKNIEINFTITGSGGVSENLSYFGGNASLFDVAGEESYRYTGQINEFPLANPLVVGEENIYNFTLPLTLDGTTPVPFPNSDLLFMQISFFGGFTGTDYNFTVNSMKLLST